MFSKKNQNFNVFSRTPKTVLYSVIHFIKIFALENLGVNKRKYSQCLAMFENNNYMSGGGMECLYIKYHGHGYYFGGVIELTH